MGSSGEPPWQSMDIVSLAVRCSEETERFRRGDPYDERPCFELFRRAVVERDQVAWLLIHEQYTPLIRSWVRKELLLYPDLLDEVEDLVQDVRDGTYDG
ncbi:MAG TPA: hypothetical protein EYP04_02005, partial [Anaerolineae bacterium]|nr:hypothetical protein [Anaerolineae bacterium]